MIDRRRTRFLAPLSTPRLYLPRCWPSLRSTLWLVLASVARRPDSANQPRLSVGVEGKCQGEGVDSAIGSDTNRYEAIEIASLFLGRIRVSYAVRVVLPASRRSDAFVARKIQLLGVRTRRSRLNLVRKSGRSNQSAVAVSQRSPTSTFFVAAWKRNIRVLRYGPIVDELVGADAEGNSIARAKVEKERGCSRVLANEKSETANGRSAS